MQDALIFEMELSFLFGDHTLSYVLVTLTKSPFPGISFLIIIFNIMTSPNIRRSSHPSVFCKKGVFLEIS